MSRLGIWARFCSSTNGVSPSAHRHGTTMEKLSSRRSMPRKRRYQVKSTAAPAVPTARAANATDAHVRRPLLPSTRCGSVEIDALLLDHQRLGSHLGLFGPPLRITVGMSELQCH